MKDPQFQFREDIVEVETEQFGKIKMQAICPKMLGTPGEIKWPGQPLGRFNKEVYCDMLGYTEEQLEQLKENGVI